MIYSILFLLCAILAVAQDNTYADWPSYADLPLNSSYPPKAAWGVWGEDDVNGALNHITSATRKQAAVEEIQSGQTFNLNLEHGFFPQPVNVERKPIVHTFQPGPGYTDDVITINTQFSTQIDGLRHFAYSQYGDSSTYRWYNDLIADYEEVIGYNHTGVLGIQQAADKGIVGRGVLLDYKGWKDSLNESFDPFAGTPIPASDLQQVAEWQGLSGNWTRPGDILVVRWGWVEAFGKYNDTEKARIVWNPFQYIGASADDEFAEWLWDKKLAMVGSDNPAFESSLLETTIGGNKTGFHQILLAGWGTHILEFLDLELLAPALHAANRSTFFMSMQPLNQKGGVASPPNAMAII